MNWTVPNHWYFWKSVAVAKRREDVMPHLRFWYAVADVAVREARQEYEMIRDLYRCPCCGSVEEEFYREEN